MKRMRKGRQERLQSKIKYGWGKGQWGPTDVGKEWPRERPMRIDQMKKLDHKIQSRSRHGVLFSFLKYPPKLSSTDSVPSFPCQIETLHIEFLISPGMRGNIVRQILRHILRYENEAGRCYSDFNIREKQICVYFWILKIRRLCL
jgi:hypothetical protein